jgi:hypothetical protein
MKKGDTVKTPHGIAKITRVQKVYGSHDDAIDVIFPDGKKSQYSTATVTLIK